MITIETFYEETWIVRYQAEHTEEVYNILDFEAEIEWELDDPDRYEDDDSIWESAREEYKKNKYLEEDEFDEESFKAEVTNEFIEEDNKEISFPDWLSEHQFEQEVPDIDEKLGLECVKNKFETFKEKTSQGMDEFKSEYLSKYSGENFQKVCEFVDEIDESEFKNPVEEEEDGDGGGDSRVLKDSPFNDQKKVTI